jgi:ribosomal 30S subunit maturation factor RimM
LKEIVPPLPTPSAFAGQQEKRSRQGAWWKKFKNKGKAFYKVEKREKKQEVVILLESLQKINNYEFLSLLLKHRKLKLKYSGLLKICEIY